MIRRPVPPSVLWALVALGLVASLALLSDRWTRERANTRVEMVLDYRSLADLSRSRGIPLDEVLDRFRAWGAGSIAVDEQTLDDLALRGQARAVAGLALQDLQAAGRAPAGTPAPDRTYLVAADPATARELQRAAEATLGPGRAASWPGPGSPVVELLGDSRLLAASGLGIPEGLVRRLHERGFRLWLRPENTPGVSPELLEARLRALAALPGVQGVIFSGVRNEALGYPDQLDRVAALLEELHLKLGLIELPDKVQQKGVETLARLATGQVVRVMAVPPAQQARTHPETVAAMYSLGARERNMRVLYLRPYADLVEELPADEANALLFDRLRADLAPLLAPEASVFPEPRGGWLVAWILASLGAGAATLLLAGQLVPVPGGAALLGLLVLAGGTALTGATGLGAHAWRSLMALGTATVFPVLGLALQLPLLDEPAGAGLSRLLRRGAGALLGASAVSLAGALMAASFLPETTYMLSVDVFRGVKLHSVLVPLLVLALWLVRRRGLDTLARLLDERVRVWHLLVLSGLALLGAVYVARTGNVTGDLAVSDSERALRRWLDAVLGVRPRFKEFLLGNPALVLAPVLASLRWQALVPLALLAAAIGQASLTDTYAHIHTPLAISLVRSALGLLVGGGLGLLGASLLVALEGWRGRPAPPR